MEQIPQAAPTLRVYILPNILINPMKSEKMDLIHQCYAYADKFDRRLISENLNKISFTKNSKFCML